MSDQPKTEGADAALVAPRALNWRHNPRESHAGTVRDEKTGADYFGVWARNVDLEQALSERDHFCNELSASLALVAGLRQEVEKWKTRAAVFEQGRQIVGDTFLERAEKAEAEVAGLRQALADEQKQHQAVLAGLRGLIVQLRQRATDDEEIAREAEEKNLLVTAGASDAKASICREIAAELDQWLAQALAGRTEQGNDH